MPPEWNTRTTVEVPELRVFGLLQPSERPTWLGSAAFSRAMLSNSNWLSSGERPRLLLPRKGLTWACAAADRRTQAASTPDKQRRNCNRMDISVRSRRQLHQSGRGNTSLPALHISPVGFYGQRLTVSQSIRPDRSPPDARH